MGNGQAKLSRDLQTLRNSAQELNERKVADQSKQRSNQLDSTSNLSFSMLEACSLLRWQVNQLKHLQFEPSETKHNNIDEPQNEMKLTDN